VQRFGGTEAGAQRPVDDLLERQPELAGATFQETGHIVVDGERGTARPGCARRPSVSTSTTLPTSEGVRPLPPNADVEPADK
jgi:hypothetical protein